MVVVQERTTLPFRMTEQQPHWPWPQATLVPVRPTWRRKTSDSFAFESQMTVVGWPLTEKLSSCPFGGSCDVDFRARDPQTRAKRRRSRRRTRMPPHPTVVGF